MEDGWRCACTPLWSTATVNFTARHNLKANALESSLCFHQCLSKSLASWNSKRGQALTRNYLKHGISISLPLILASCMTGPLPLRGLTPSKTGLNSSPVICPAMITSAHNTAGSVRKFSLQDKALCPFTTWCLLTAVLLSCISKHPKTSRKGCQLLALEQRQELQWRPHIPVNGKETNQSWHNIYWVFPL